MEDTAEGEKEQRGKILEFVKQAGHEIETVEPITQESSLENLQEAVESWLTDPGDIVTGNPTTKATADLGFLGRLKGRFIRKAEEEEEAA